MAAGLELLEEAHEVVQGGLALPRGTGGEEDEAGVTGGNQATGQFVAHVAVVADEPTLLMGVQADLQLHLRDLRKLLMVGGNAGGEGDEKRAPVDEGEEEGDDGRRVVAADGDDTPGYHVRLIEAGLPGGDLVDEPVVGIGLIAPDHEGLLGQFGEAVAEPG